MQVTMARTADEWHEERGPNFKAESLKYIAETVMEHYGVLYGDESLDVGMRTKHAIWVDMSKAVTNIEGIQRTWRAVRKRWEDSKRMARKKCIAILQCRKRARRQKLPALDGLDKDIIRVSLPDLYAKWQSFDSSKDVEGDPSTEEESDGHVKAKRKRRRASRRLAAKHKDTESEDEPGTSAVMISEGSSDDTVQQSVTGGGGDTDVAAVNSPSALPVPAEATPEVDVQLSYDSSADEQAHVDTTARVPSSPVGAPVGGVVAPPVVGHQEQMLAVLNKLADGQEQVLATLQVLADGQRAMCTMMANKLQDINVANCECGKKVRQMSTNMSDQHREHMSVLTFWCDAMAKVQGGQTGQGSSMSAEEDKVTVLVIKSSEESDVEEAGGSAHP